MFFVKRCRVAGEAQFWGPTRELVIAPKKGSQAQSLYSRILRVDNFGLQCAVAIANHECLVMPPLFLRNLRCFAEAAKRVSAIGKANNISFFALFLADAGSVFGSRQDHNKHEIFVRLSKVGVLVPYLANTVLFSTSHPWSIRAFTRHIRFPVVIKPIWGLQSVGIIGIHDRATLRRFLRKRHGFYLAQHLIRDGVEIGVSYTRNPAGPPDFFGVACKEPVRSPPGWNKGIYRVPKYFYHHDVTNGIDRDRFIVLCRKIAETLRVNSLRFDAFIQKEGGLSLKFDTLQIIDVNTGPFALDEFLFDPNHSVEFVVEQLTRKYTHLLLWGARHSPRPDLSSIRKLTSHFLYCCLVTLLCHVSARSLMRSLMKTEI
jgi:hypothetical protein